MNNKQNTPLFMTHHSPVGAYSSLTFGLPGQGASIESESNEVSVNADLYVAVSRGEGRVDALPFVTGIVEKDLERNHEASADVKISPNEISARWNFIQPAELKRTLSGTIDEYAGGDIQLRIYTPHPSLPDPELESGLVYEVCPGLLIDLTIDNTEYDQPAYGFIGLKYCSKGRIRPLDWSTQNKLSGIAYSGEWALAAQTEEGRVFTVRDNSIARSVEKGNKVVHMGGQEGGILFHVPARTKQTLPAAFGFYKEGTASQVIEGHYWYTKHYNRVEEVCEYVLHQAERIRRDCESEDMLLEQRSVDRREYEIYSQAVRAYYANTQLLESGGQAYYSVNEGQYLWKNTMDLAADHLPFELWRNPWVVRNMMDLFIDRYAYFDQVRFAERPGECFPGGISFTHDMGNYCSYSPAGYSGYEMEDARFYCYMTTEELLNGVYMMTGYALSASGKEWGQRRSEIMVQLLTSMENRDHFEPSQRDGILKGISTRGGLTTGEITTYDSLDHALAGARGNLYIAVKTLCASRLLERWFQVAQDTESERRAREMAEKTAKSLQLFFSPEDQYFRANLYEENSTLLIAAIEPLAVPYNLGLELADVTGGNEELAEMFSAHLKYCLQPGRCLDEATGGLRLSSGSRNTWTSKVILSVFVMDKIWGIKLDDYPEVMRELVHWCQVSAREKTIADQIFSDCRTAVGGFYYPRAITSALWMHPCTAE
ncbi:Beta-xylosidase precursor [compost metagenome]